MGVRAQNRDGLYDRIVLTVIYVKVRDAARVQELKWHVRSCMKRLKLLLWKYDNVSRYWNRVSLQSKPCLETFLSSKLHETDRTSVAHKASLLFP